MRKAIALIGFFTTAIPASAANHICVLDKECRETSGCTSMEGKHEYTRGITLSEFDGVWTVKLPGAKDQIYQQVWDMMDGEQRYVMLSRQPEGYPLSSTVLLAPGKNMFWQSSSPKTKNPMTSASGRCKIVG